METNIVTQLDFCKQWQVQVWCIQVPFESIRSLWSANKSVTLLVLEINRSNRIRSIDLLPNSLYLMISSPLETSVVASVCVSVVVSIVVSASVASCRCVSNDQWWCCLSPSWSLSGLSWVHWQITITVQDEQAIRMIWKRSTENIFWTLQTLWVLEVWLLGIHAVHCLQPSLIHFWQPGNA